MHIHISGCRYRVTANAGQGHLVLEKTSKLSELEDAEVVAIRGTFPSANLKDCIVYNRVLISGVMYTSTSYKRPITTIDHIVCWKDRRNHLGWHRDT